jgi:hypothetical protein
MLQMASGLTPLELDMTRDTPAFDCGDSRLPNIVMAAARACVAVARKGA